MIARKEFLRASAGLAGIASLVLEGCGSRDDDSNSTGLIIGLDREPALLNSYIVGGESLATANVTRPIMEGVLQVQPDLSYASRLAEGDPQVISEDPLRIKFKLREGLTWSDGEPLTSEDWKFTYETVMSDRWQIATRDIWSNVDEVETPDEWTVHVNFRKPDARWRDMLTADVLPRHVLRGRDFNKAFSDEIVGSGPYVFEKWDKGRSLTIVRNKNYWGKKPAIERVTFRFMPDARALETALRSGEAHFINPAPDVGLIEELEDYDGVQVQTAYGTAWEHLAFQLEKVEDLGIRRAIAHGLNRGRLVDEVLQGNARPLESVLVPENDDFYTPAWKRYSFNQKKARRLVEQAGSEGVSTEIEYSTTSDSALRETTQQAIKEQMKEIGITLQENNSSTETFLGRLAPQGAFEAGEWAWSASPDPSITSLFGANRIPPDGQNYYRYRNEEVTELMREADATIDQRERARLIRQAQDLIAEDVPLIPLYQRPEIYAYDENLRGPKVNPTLATAFWNIGEWRFGE